MVTSILLAGVGGQGIILTSKILSAGLAQMGFDVKMSEIHGMSQRGGSVTTQIKYGDRVYAPNIGAGEADIVVAFERCEALRCLPYLKTGGRVITDEREIYPLPVLTGAAAYPDDAIARIEAAGAAVTVVRAAAAAQQLGSGRAQNIVLLGALVRALDLGGADWRALVAKFVPQKAVDMNLAAFDAGYNICHSLQTVN